MNHIELSTLTKLTETLTPKHTNTIEIPKLLRMYRCALVEAEWQGFETLAGQFRSKIDTLEFKQSIGETHEQPW